MPTAPELPEWAHRALATLQGDAAFAGRQLGDIRNCVVNTLGARIDVDLEAMLAPHMVMPDFPAGTGTPKLPEVERRLFDGWIKGMLPAILAEQARNIRVREEARRQEEELAARRIAEAKARAEAEEDARMEALEAQQGAYAAWKARKASQTAEAAR